MFPAQIGDVIEELKIAVGPDNLWPASTQLQAKKALESDGGQAEICRIRLASVEVVGAAVEAVVRGIIGAVVTHEFPEKAGIAYACFINPSRIRSPGPASANDLTARGLISQPRDGHLGHGVIDKGSAAPADEIEPVQR